MSQSQCDIDYLCLATHMTPECTIKDEVALKEKISKDSLNYFLKMLSLSMV